MTPVPGVARKSALAALIALVLWLGAFVVARGLRRPAPAAPAPPAEEILSRIGCGDAPVGPDPENGASTPRDDGSLAALTVDYPREGSIVPPDFAAPTFLWHDASPADAWFVEVVFAGGACRMRVALRGDPPASDPIDRRVVAATNAPYRPTPYQAAARSWKPSASLWAAIQRESAGRAADFTFSGFRRAAGAAQAVSRGRMTLTLSLDPVGAPIFYRDVPLMPAKTENGVIKPLDQRNVPLIEWRLKDVSRSDSRLMLTDMPTCANCHSFSNDGRTLGMDIDGPQGDKGAYAVVPVARQITIDDGDVMTWNAYRKMRPGLNSLGFMSRVSPDGRFVVSTVNEDLYVRNFTDYRFIQVFFPTRGILAWYARSTGAIEALPGADDPDYVHCDPVWTPDGRTLVFARAPARDAYIRGRPDATHPNDPNETPIQYDLYRIPFAEGRGGRAEPIAGAADNGTSNSFPKVTPDGRFVVFVRSRNGQLLRPDGRLWIVPLAGGAPRLMRCNLEVMNSWHSVSPNGRWMVFTSKTETPYTRMYLTHLDADGNDSPALLIEGTTAANRAVNLPEFVNARYDDLQGINVPAVDFRRRHEEGIALAAAGRYREAVIAYEKALRGEAFDWTVTAWRVHADLSKALLMLGDKERAAREIEASLRLHPGNGEMHANLGYILSEEGDLDGALAHLETAVRLMPRDPLPRTSRATLLMKRGRTEAAIDDYTEAIRLDPACADAWLGRGLARRSRGDVAGARVDFARALAVAPAGWPRRSQAQALLAGS